MVIIVVCTVVGIVALAAVFFLKPNLFMFDLAEKALADDDEKPADTKQRR
jgi:hypothetical protein